MAKYDHGGGCACGLRKECDCKTSTPKIETTRWGNWKVLYEDRYYKVKRLVIKPLRYISEQYHNHRTETWTIVQGECKVMLDGFQKYMKEGDSFVVKIGMIHQVINTSPDKDLIAIEVQYGEKVEESDIIRLST